MISFLLSVTALKCNRNYLVAQFLSGGATNLSFWRQLNVSPSVPFWDLFCFLIFTSDLGKEIQTKIHIYADDTIIYMHAPSHNMGSAKASFPTCNCTGLKLGFICS